MPRWIIHVDMDAFYASVEQRDNPELRGKPVIVGGSPEQRGVVSAASYEARKFGVHSAMPSVTARRLCPQGAFLPVRMDRYAEVSCQIRQILLSFTPVIEPLSLDEAFLDVTGSLRLLGSAEAVGRQIKARVREELQLTASVGIAPNKFLAKLASDLRKPDGFVVVREDEKEAFLAPLPVSRVWGVGKVTEAELHKLGVMTIGDLRRLPLSALKGKFGQAAEALHELALGIDEREVVTEAESKSIGSEVTFPVDIADVAELQRTLLRLCEEVGARLRHEGVQGRTVTLKIRFPDFTTITRRVTLPSPTDLTEDLYAQSRQLLEARAGLKGRAVRLVGVSASNLGAKGVQQLPLFPEPRQAKLREVARAVDAIRRKAGDQAIVRASLIEKAEKRKRTARNSNHVAS